MLPQACTLCSCKKLAEPACTTAIKGAFNPAHDTLWCPLFIDLGLGSTAHMSLVTDGLYAVIGSMPALAYSVFKGCKSLCVQ